MNNFKNKEEPPMCKCNKSIFALRQKKFDNATCFSWLVLYCHRMKE